MSGPREIDRLILKRGVACLVLLGSTEPSAYIFDIEKKIIVIELRASGVACLVPLGSTKPGVDHIYDIVVG